MPTELHCPYCGVMRGVNPHLLNDGRVGACDTCGTVLWRAGRTLERV